MSFAALIFLCVSCLALGWVVLNVHPDSGTATMVSGDTKLKLVDKLDIYMNNLASDALGELAYIRKIYAIEESATVAPKPPEENFGVTDDPAVIQAVIDEAWELLEGQEVIWNPDLDFVPGEPMRYYYDETILVIQWKEYIDQRCCTCAEVKVANGSQIRRKLSEDTYGSSVQLYASQMAEAVNSVIAMEIPDEPGALDKILDVFAAVNVNIEYMYSFIIGHESRSAGMIFRVNDTAAAETKLAAKGIQVLSLEDIQ